MKQKFYYNDKNDRALNFQVGVGEAHVFEQSFVLLANEGFAVVAGDVVPMDAILVEVVEHCKAILWSPSLDCLAVVRLRFLDATHTRIL